MTDAERIEQLETQAVALITANATLVTIVAGLLQRPAPILMDQNKNILSQEQAKRTRATHEAPIPPFYMTTSGEIVRGEVVRT